LQEHHRQSLEPVFITRFVAVACRMRMLRTDDVERSSRLFDNISSLLNAIFRTVVQQLTRFQLSRASRGPSAIDNRLPPEVIVQTQRHEHTTDRLHAVDSH